MPSERLPTDDDPGRAAPAPGRPFVEPAGLRPLALAALLAVVVFGYLGFRSSNPWLLLLACAAGGPFLTSWLMRPRLEAVTVASGVAPRAVVGEPVAWALVLRNTGRRTTPALLVTDRLPGYDDASVLVAPIPPGGTAHVATTRAARRRALSEGHEVTLSTTAPFGMVERRRVLANRRVSVVHPLPSPPLDRFVRGADGEDAANAPARTGPDLHAVREWRPGDESRHVHWRSSARHGRLVVVEPERTVSRRLAVLVAGRPQSPGWEPLLARVAGTVAVAARAEREMLLVARDARAARLWDVHGPDARPGLAVHASRDGADVLDLVAALDAVASPEDDDLEVAVGWAGAGADVVVATTDPFEASWWSGQVTRAAVRDVRLLLLLPQDAA